MRSRNLVRLIVAAIAALVASSLPARAYPHPGRTELVSRSLSGTSGRAPSIFPSLSADGRFVAFESDASDMVPHDTNGATDIFVLDRKTGVTERVSVSPDGSGAGGHSYKPSISADGRYVAFESDAQNLVPPDPGDDNFARDVFVHDRSTGTTEIVSVATDGTQGTQYSGGPAISADGRVVAFYSYSQNLTPGDTNSFGNWDVFVRYLDTDTTVRVSVARDGGSLATTEWASGHAISADGSVVAFLSNSEILVDGDTNELPDAFARDLTTGVTERLAVPAGQEPNGQAYGVSLSDDGRFAAVQSDASNLVPNDANRVDDLFLYDRVSRAIERVSVSSTGDEGNSSSYGSAVSADGRYVAFGSAAGNFSPGDADAGTDPVFGPIGDADVFVHDRLTGATERASLADDGSEPDSAHGVVALSDDGRVVAFDSGASNLAGVDPNGVADVFVRNRGPALGIGELRVTAGDDHVRLDGWASFSDGSVVAAGDPVGDGAPGAAAAGAEIARARAAYRPEVGDVSFAVDVTALPSVRAYHPPLPTGVRQYGRYAPSTAASPGVLYTFTFVSGGGRFEVRAERPGSGGSAGAAEFTLWRCSPACERSATIAGSLGTAGDSVRASVPLTVLDGSASLTGITASTAVGSAGIGSAVELDSVGLADLTLRAPEVRVALAPRGTPESEVAFDATATLVDGSFTASLARGFLPAGEYDAWARACVSGTCRSSRAPVTLT